MSNVGAGLSHVCLCLCLPPSRDVIASSSLMLCLEDSSSEWILKWHFGQALICVGFLLSCVVLNPHR